MESSRPGGATNKQKEFTGSKWHWKPEEDDHLTKLVQRFGPNNWDIIAKYFQGRSGKSCRLRWVNQLNPQVDKNPFSADERRRLLELHRRYGNKWSMISKLIPGRTDNQVKNQYHVLMGTRTSKTFGPPFCAGPSEIAKHGNEICHQFGSAKTMGFSSPFPHASCHEDFNGPILCSAPMPDEVKMPFFSYGGSSVNGLDQSFFAAHCSEPGKLGPHSSGSVDNGSIYLNSEASTGDSLISDAKSAETTGLHPIAQPDQGLYLKDCKFIDFLGVGNQE